MKLRVIFLVLISISSFISGFPSRLQVLDKRGSLSFQRVCIYHDMHAVQDEASLTDQVTALCQTYQQLTQNYRGSFLLEFPPQQHVPLLEDLCNRIQKVSWLAKHKGKFIIAMGRQAHVIERARPLDERPLQRFLAVTSQEYWKWYFSERVTALVLYGRTDLEHISAKLNLSVGEVFNLWHTIVSQMTACAAHVRTVLRDGASCQKIAYFEQELQKIRAHIENASLTWADKSNTDWMLFMYEQAKKAYEALPISLLVAASSSQLEAHCLSQLRYQLPDFREIFDFFLSESFVMMQIDLCFASEVLSTDAHYTYILVGAEHGENIAHMLTHAGFDCVYDSFITLHNESNAKDLRELLEKMVHLKVQVVADAIKPLSRDVYTYPVLSQAVLKEVMLKQNKSELTSNKVITKAQIANDDGVQFQARRRRRRERKGLCARWAHKIGSFLSASTAFEKSIGGS